GPSYVVHLYLNRPDVADDAFAEAGRGHAGHFTVFGHGECWGDLGHCDVPTGALHAFDRRPPHPLTPINITVEVTDALKALGDDARLRGRAVIVGSWVVMAASYEARVYGVHGGMPTARARLACPEAIVVDPCWPAYVESSKAVFEVFSHFSEVVEAASMEE